MRNNLWFKPLRNDQGELPKRRACRPFSTHPALPSRLSGVAERRTSRSEIHSETAAGFKRIGSLLYLDGVLARHSLLGTAVSCAAADVLQEGLFWIGFRCGRGVNLGGYFRLLQKAVSISSAQVILLEILANQLHFDGAPAAIEISLRVVTERIEVSQVIPDRGEGISLLAPIASKIGFAAGSLAHAFKGGGGDWLLLSLAGADDVDDGSRRLGQLGHVLRRD